MKIVFVLVMLITYSNARAVEPIVNTTDKDMLCYSIQTNQQQVNKSDQYVPFNQQVVWKYIAPGELAMPNNGGYYDMCFNEKVAYMDRKALSKQDTAFQQTLKEQNVFNFRRFIGKDRAFVESIYGDPLACQQVKSPETDATQFCVYFREHFFYGKDDRLLFIMYPASLSLSESLPFEEESLLNLTAQGRGITGYKIPLAPWTAQDYSFVYNAVKAKYVQEKKAHGVIESYEWLKPMKGIKKIALSNEETYNTSEEKKVDYMIIEFE